MVRHIQQVWGSFWVSEYLNGNNWYLSEGVRNGGYSAAGGQMTKGFIRQSQRVQSLVDHAGALLSDLGTALLQHMEASGPMSSLGGGGWWGYMLG